MCIELEIWNFFPLESRIETQWIKIYDQNVGKINEQARMKSDEWMTGCWYVNNKFSEFFVYSYSIYNNWGVLKMNILNSIKCEKKDIDILASLAWI